MNQMSISFFFIFLFTFALMSFLIQRKTILSALLSLEGMILSCLLPAFFITESSASMIIFILIIAACESAFGLTILVFISRAEETDKLFFLKC